MAAQALEDRITVIENELAQIKRQLGDEKSRATPGGWEKMFGIFADSEGFEEATRLGREYREAQVLEESKEAG